VEPFQDDILSRRLDDLTHQIRTLSLAFSTFQLDQRQQRYADRWDLAEATQKALAEMLKVQQTVLEHQRTINGRLAMYVEQQTAINDRLATTLEAIKDLVERHNGRDA
jgi:phosphopantetheinyl transferase (holo-ACP synthase)